MTRIQILHDVKQWEVAVVVSDHPWNSCRKRRTETPSPFAESIGATSWGFSTQADGDDVGINGYPASNDLKNQYFIVKHPSAPHRKEFECLTTGLIIGVGKPELPEDVSSEPSLHTLDSIGIFNEVRTLDRWGIFKVWRNQRTVKIDHGVDLSGAPTCPNDKP